MDSDDSQATLILGAASPSPKRRARHPLPKASLQTVQTNAKTKSQGVQQALKKPSASKFHTSKKETPASSNGGNTDKGNTCDTKGDTKLGDDTRTTLRRMATRMHQNGEDSQGNYMDQDVDGKTQD